jgi:hypothetical protein
MLLGFTPSKWGGIERYPRARGLEDVPSGEAAKWVTALVSAERVCEGAIESAVRDGTMARILDRLCRGYFDEGCTRSPAWLSRANGQPAEGARHRVGVRGHLAAGQRMWRQRQC